MARQGLVKRLDALARRAGWSDTRLPSRLDEAGWLALVEKLGRDGGFDGEPDFSTAVVLYGTALARARASSHFPFEPPADFQPHERDRHRRRVSWRTEERFPELAAAGEWLCEMLGRLRDGVPPVSEAEFANLAVWFRANEARLYELSLPMQSLELSAWRQTSCSEVSFALDRGPRVRGAGQVAEDVRRLKVRYEEGDPLMVAGGVADALA